MNDPTKKRILLGLTGGIAAYKAAELLRLLKQEEIDVQVVLTEAASRFVGEATLQALSGNPVYSDLWDSRINNNMAHIELSRDRGAIVIAPLQTLSQSLPMALQMIYFRPYVLHANVH